MDNPEHRITSLEELAEIYGEAGAASLRKVAQSLTPDYAKWIERSRFCVLSTVGPEGTDGSPRGDVGPVVQQAGPRTLLLPDWRGNNRTDSLRNIIRDDRVSLMFMVPGSNGVVRVNGRAVLSRDPDILARFDDRGRLPRCCIMITTEEIYFQCARALMRSDLWAGEDHSHGLPSPGEILSGMTDGTVGGPGYDAEWPERAKKSMW